MEGGPLDQAAGEWIEPCSVLSMPWRFPTEARTGAENGLTKVSIMEPVVRVTILEKSQLGL